jgi:hypothetical protein
MSGYLPPTLADATVSTIPVDAVALYREEQSGLHPYARVSYDFFVTPITSISLRAAFVPQPDLEVPEQNASIAFRGNTWSATQGAYSYGTSPVTLGFGLRTHLF